MRRTKATLIYKRQYATTCYSTLPHGRQNERDNQDVSGGEKLGQLAAV